jgi:O-antigen/teichoic acid export membrane protein
MSRLKKYARSLVSGYVLLGANVAFTLATVPLALAYLPTAEFGLWALATQLAGYLALLDLGMGGVSRILVDYKDHKEDGGYGSVIQTFLWVSVVQGGLLLVGGAVMGLGLRTVLRVPEALAKEFAILLVGQSVLLAGNFLTRILTYLLSSHQRYDLSNYAHTAGFCVNFAVLWLGFHHGLGVYSLLCGQVSAWAVAAVTCLVWCLRLRLFPRAGCWGRPSLARFREIFAFSLDVFLYLLGAQIVNASQTILVTRLLGLEVAAVWSICTRTYQFLVQAVNRLFDYSCPALAEMIVRQERERLFRRFHSLAVLAGSLAVWAGVIFAVCNQPFVEVWAGGRIRWDRTNDVLLAVWLAACAPAYCHLGLVGQRKEFRGMRFLFLVEGLCFVGASLWVLAWGGVTAMLVVSVLCALSIRLPYGLWRTKSFFGVAAKAVVWEWFWPSLRLTLLFAPLGFLTAQLAPYCSALIFVAVGGPSLGVVGLALLLRHGLTRDMQEELLQRSPAWVQRPLRCLRLVPQGCRSS